MDTDAARNDMQSVLLALGANMQDALRWASRLPCADMPALEALPAPARDAVLQMATLTVQALQADSSRVETKLRNVAPNLFAGATEPDEERRFVVTSVTAFLARRASRLLDAQGPVTPNRAYDVARLVAAIGMIQATGGATTRRARCRQACKEAFSALGILPHDQHLPDGRRITRHSMFVRPGEGRGFAHAFVTVAVDARTRARG